MKSYFNANFTRYFKITSIVFLLLTLLPFLILSIYTNPCWDDFDYSGVAAEYGFWESQYIWYMGWSGRFFSTAVLSSVNPLVFKSILGYKIFPVVLIISLLLLTYFFIREITLRAISKTDVILCTLVICSLYFFKMANVSLGFYWLSSAVIYQIASLLMLLLFTLMLIFFRTENGTKRKILGAFITILIFAVEGSNEISMVVLIELLIFIFAINYIYNKKINWSLFYFVAVSLIAFCVVYFAPGNKVRAVENPGSHQLINSIFNSIIDTTKFIPYRILDTPLLLFTILFIPFSSKIISSKKIYDNIISINPVYSLLAYFIILASCFFTTYWSLGGGYFDRTVNVVYFLFLFGWFINVLILVNFYQRKYKLRIAALPGYALIILCLLILLSLSRENNVRIAYKDLISGNAAKFDNELKERYDKIYTDKADTCIVESIKLPVPTSLSFFDVGDDPQFRYNRLQAQYFNKKFFIVKGNDSGSVKVK